METKGETRSGGRPRLVNLAVGAAAIGLGRQLRRQHERVGKVAKEIRSPVLYLPTHLTNDRTLQFARRALQWPTPVAPNITVTNTTALGEAGQADVPVLVYEGAGRSRPSGALLWIHGGGTVMGHPKQSHAFCSRVAGELGLLVVSVDYRLAPEHPFPAGLDDCYTALSWLSRTAEDTGVDPARIAIGGDSAGGGLSASLAQVARDRGGPSVRFQLLVYPMLDDRTVLAGDRDGRGDLIWTRPSNRYAWTAYLGHEPTQADERPYAAAARCPDLSGLPPAWIGVGDLDLFYAEDIDYARRLEDAGVPCDLHVEPGMYHGADAVLPAVPSMKAFRDRMVDALGSALVVDAGSTQAPT